MVAIGEIIILNQGSGGAEQTVNFELIGDETGEAESGIFRWTLLKIGWLVGLIDDN